ncbi:hypothetical protein HanPI659440_Chr09g0337141 [Helianthus annuus]|nr:hypothetical protein HanPI659440_Chr09g0337141 [Helianthus annuus]
MQVACGRSTGLWCLKGILESREDPRPCRWSLLFVNQAGDLERSCDASSVSVRMFRLMRNSQPRVGCHLLVCRTNLETLLGVCTNFKPTSEMMVEDVHKLRTNL